MKKISIAIDGHSSTGKSTLARELAKSLGYVYIDSGAMYRAVALFAIENGLVADTLDEAGLLENLQALELDFEVNPETGRSEIHLNGKNVEKQIRTIEVSRFVSEVAAIPEVRTKLVGLQQTTARRYKELLDRGEKVSYEEVLKNVRHRDHLDSNRDVSPLMQATDAIHLDNSDMGLKEQYERVRSYADRILKAKK